MSIRHSLAEGLLGHDAAVAGHLMIPIETIRVLVPTLGEVG
jgi:hypothetical protein